MQRDCLLFKVTFIPGYGVPGYKATREKPFVLYVPADDVDEAANLARLEVLQHTVEPFECLGVEAVLQANVPADAEWPSWCDASGAMAHEAGRIISTPAFLAVNGKEGEASPTACWTPMTQDVVDALRGQGQEVTMTPMTDEEAIKRAGKPKG